MCIGFGCFELGLWLLLGALASLPIMVLDVKCEARMECVKRYGYMAAAVKVVPVFLELV